MSHSSTVTRLIMTGRERGLARERGGFPRFFRGQSRRYSPSPEVRYYRGEGGQAGCHKGGEIGEIGLT